MSYIKLFFVLILMSAIKIGNAQDSTLGYFKEGAFIYRISQEDFENVFQSYIDSFNYEGHFIDAAINDSIPTNAESVPYLILELPTVPTHYN